MAQVAVNDDQLGPLPEGNSKAPAGGRNGIRRSNTGERMAAHRYSVATAKLDIDNKGYLDSFERVIRKYDSNGDGSFSLNEIKNIVMDLKSEEAKAKSGIRLAGAIAALAVVAMAMMYAIVVGANESTKETRVASGSDVLVGNDGGAVAVDAATTLGPMTDWVEYTIPTLERIEVLTFQTGDCDATADEGVLEENVYRVAAIYREGDALEITTQVAGVVVTITADGATLDTTAAFWISRASRSMLP